MSCHTAQSGVRQLILTPIFKPFPTYNRTAKLLTFFLISKLNLKNSFQSLHYQRNNPLLPTAHMIFMSLPPRTQRRSNSSPNETNITFRKAEKTTGNRCAKRALPLPSPCGLNTIIFWSIFGLNSVIDFSRFNRTPIVTQSIPDSYPIDIARDCQREEREERIPDAYINRTVW